MLDAIYNQLERIATWPIVVLLFVVFVLCAQGFELRRKSLGYDNPSLDGRLWYSPDDARDFFDSIGERGRRIYATTEITLDLLFPLVYGTLFAAMMIHLYSRDSARVLILVPLLTVVADLLENFTAAYLAWQFDGRSSPITKGAAIFTATKTVLFIVSHLVLLVGALKAIRHSYSPPA